MGKPHGASLYQAAAGLKNNQSNARIHRMAIHPKTCPSRFSADLPVRHQLIRLVPSSEGRQDSR